MGLYRPLGPGQGLGKAWARPGQGLGKAWARPGQGLGKAWARPGQGLGKAWARPGQGLGKAWAWTGFSRRIKTNRSWGERSFASAVSSLWNDLPGDAKLSPSLTAFKTALKTQLMRIASLYFISTLFVVCFCVSLVHVVSLWIPAHYKYSLLLLLFLHNSPAGQSKQDACPVMLV